MANEIATIEMNTPTDIMTTYAMGENVPVVRYTTTSETATMFNAVNGGAKKLKEFIGETLTVTDIIITSAEVRENASDEKSPMVNRPCVHLFTDLGEHISSLSVGICRGVSALMATGIIPTAESPLKMKIITVDTKRGTAHSFELVK